eukprot:COSAG05_NODE_189_length_14633_cov_44.869134_4_plen_1996_part_00
MADNEKANEHDPDTEDADDLERAVKRRSIWCCPGRQGSKDSPQWPFPSNVFRKRAVWLVQLKPFNNIILLLIMVNCGILALQTPTVGSSVKCEYPALKGTFDAQEHNCDTSKATTEDERLRLRRICEQDGECSENGPLIAGFEQSNLAANTEIYFTIAFTCEALAKIIASGFIMHQGAYLRNSWNWLDWIVVVMSWVSMLPGVENFSAIRTVRVLRPLRTMSRVPNMGLIVGAMIKSLRPLANVLLLCIVIFFIFGILAVQFWSTLPKMACSSDYYQDQAYWSGTDGNNNGTDYTCHDLETHMTTGVRCDADQLGDDYQQGAGSICTGIKYTDSKKKKKVKFMEGIISDDEIATKMRETTGDSSYDWQDAEDGAMKYNYTLDTDCPCGQVCTPALNFYCDSMGAISFDSIGETMVAIFQSVSLEGWTDIMYRTNEAYGIPLGVPYFMALILFAGLFVVNLALAVIAESYTEATEEEKARKREAEEEDEEKRKKEAEERAFAGAGDEGPNLNGPGAGPRNVTKNRCKEKFKRSRDCKKKMRFLKRVVDDSKFTWFVMFFIGINTTLLAVEQHDDSLCTKQEQTNEGELLGLCMDTEVKDFLESANVFLTFFFLAEMILKIIALGLFEYLAEPFNQFDAFIVVTSMIELIIAMAAPAGGDSGGFITVLRAGRLIRVFKLARSWATLRKVLTVVNNTLPTLMPLSIILCLFMFIYSLLGMQLFGGYFFFPGRTECYSWEREKMGCSIPRANFDSFGEAFVTIFQMMTGEDWNVVMYDGIRTAGPITALYFFILVLFGNYLILNLFLAILLGGFEAGAEDDDDNEEEEEEEISKDGDPSNKSCCPCGRSKVAPEHDDEDEDSPGLRLQGPVGIREAANDAAPGLKIPEGRALFFLPHTNSFRMACFRVINNKYFENTILFCIIASSLALAVQNPVAHDGPNKFNTGPQILSWMDLAFLIIFTCEFILKHLALGAFMHTGAFWTDPWNFMDGTIVFVGWLGFLSNDLPQLKPLRAVRTMRALRPLRALRRFPGMKLAVNCLLRSIPLMFPMALVSFLFFLIFGILGLQLFGGKYWYCEMQSDVSPEDYRDSGYKFVTELLNQSDASKPTFTDDSRDWARKILEKEVNEPLSDGDILDEFPYLKLSSFKKRAEELFIATDEYSNYFEHNFCEHENCINYNWNTLDNSTAAGVPMSFDKFCHDPKSFHGAKCTRAECRLVGGVWKNQMTHFDNIVQALLCLFEMSTTEGWPTVMWNGVDAGEIGEQPVQAQAFSSVAFFISWLIVGNFFVLNLFVGAVIDNYLELEGEAKKDMELMTPEQQEWVETQKKMVGLQLRSKIPEPSSRWRRVVYDIVNKQSFDLFVTLLIVVNVVILAAKHRVMSTGFEDVFLVGSNWFFTVAFVIEAAMKLTAFGAVYYFKSGWNCFDFFLVISSIVDKFIDAGGLASFFRIFRVARIVRIARSASDLRRMFQTIIISLPALGNVGTLLLLLFFIYAILGVNFFHSACAVAPFYASMSQGIETDGFTPMDVAEVKFDPCNDMAAALAFDGYVSVNLQQNIWLWAGMLTDVNNDGRISKQEFDDMKGSSSFNKTWPSQEAGDVDMKNTTAMRFLFGKTIDQATFDVDDQLTTTTGPFMAWAEKNVDRLDGEHDAEDVPYVPKQKNGLPNFRMSDYNWIGDYQLDSKWTKPKLRCTALTHKCDGYLESEIPLLDPDQDKDGTQYPPYAACKCENIDANANFRNFGTAFETLIRMSTGEYWNGLMHDLTDVEGHTYSFVYFFTFLMLATFIMLNLVVAVMIINYEEQQADSERAVNQDHMDHFRDVWEGFDAEGIGWIRTEKLLALLENLDIPLGFHSSKPMAKVAKKKALQELAMQLPDHDGWIHYTETLFALAYRNMSEAAVDELEEKDDGNNADEIEEWKRRNVDASMAEGGSEPKPLQQTIAVLSFQAVYRSYQERRNKGGRGVVDPLERKLRPSKPGASLSPDDTEEQDNAGTQQEYRAAHP